MLSERKFNIEKFKMTEEMRTSILDEVRRVIEANTTDILSSQNLKNTLEEKYGGKWQIVIGKDLAVYFDENVIRDYIILQTEIKKMIIFRKKTAEEILLAKIQAQSKSPTKFKKEDSSKLQPSKGL